MPSHLRYLDPSTGSPSGIDVDLTKHFAQVIFDDENIEGRIRWVPLDPRDNELALEQNKVDMVVGRYGITVARKNFVDFAGPYFADPQSFLIDTQAVQRRDKARSPTRLISTARRFVWLLVRPMLFLSKSWCQTLTPPLSAKRSMNVVLTWSTDTVDGIVASYVDELGLMKTSGKLEALDSRYAAAQYGIGVKKGISDFRSFLNNQIEEWEEYDDVVTTWVGPTNDLGALR